MTFIGIVDAIRLLQVAVSPSAEWTLVNQVKLIKAKILDIVPWRVGNKKAYMVSFDGSDNPRGDETDE